MSSVNEVLSEISDKAKNNQNVDDHKSASGRWIKSINVVISELGDNEKKKNNDVDRRESALDEHKSLTNREISKLDNNEKNGFLEVHKSASGDRTSQVNGEVSKMGDDVRKGNKTNFNCAFVSSSHLDGGKCVGQSQL